MTGFFSKSAAKTSLPASNGGGFMAFFKAVRNAMRAGGAVLLGCAGLAAPAHAEWTEAKSPHFTVYADAPESELKSRTLRLERFDAALRGLFKVEGDDSTTLYVTHGAEEIRRLIGRDNVLGFYRGDAQGPVAFIPETLGNNISGITPDQIMFHEYTHHILLSNEKAVYPSWVTEGLAELFSTASFRSDGSVVIGAQVKNRGYAMLGMSHWTVKRLLDSDVHRPTDDERIELYSRGWLLCHYLLISGKRPGQFFAYIAAVNKGQKPLEAAQAVFGDLDKLNGEIESYIAQGSLPSSVLSAERIKAATNVTLRKLTPGEAAIMPYRMASANGVNSTTAGPLAAKAHAAADRFTDDAFVQRALAEMDFDARDYERADAEAARALALDPANMMAMIYRGRVAAMKAVKAGGPQADGLWKEARGWFLKANKQSGDYALPYILFYDSFIAAGQPVPKDAQEGLKAAAILAPSDSFVRVRLADVLIHAGEIAQARALLAPLAANVDEGGQTPFVKLVQTIDGGADQATVVAKLRELKLDGFNEFRGGPDEKDGSQAATKKRA